MEQQKKIIEINKLIMKEKTLLKELLEEKNKYHAAVLDKML
jgi:hypothetical protein